MNLADLTKFGDDGTVREMNFVNVQTGGFCIL